MNQSSVARVLTRQPRKANPSELDWPPVSVPYKPGLTVSETRRSPCASGRCQLPLKGSGGTAARSSPRAR
jgi:hypothetical protein